MCPMVFVSTVKCLDITFNELFSQEQFTLCWLWITKNNPVNRLIEFFSITVFYIKNFIYKYLEIYLIKLGVNKSRVPKYSLFRVSNIFKWRVWLKLQLSVEINKKTTDVTDKSRIIDQILHKIWKITSRNVVNRADSLDQLLCLPLASGFYTSPFTLTVVLLISGVLFIRKKDNEFDCFIYIRYVIKHQPSS